MVSPLQGSAEPYHFGDQNVSRLNRRIYCEGLLDQRYLYFGLKFWERGPAIVITPLVTPLTNSDLFTVWTAWAR